jgi:hypothetical protein
MVKGQDTHIDVALASEVKDLSAKNIIAIGNPCDNNLVKELMGLDSCLSNPMTPQIAIVNRPGSKFMMIAGGELREETRVAARILATYENFKLTGGRVCVGGTIESPLIVPC